MIQTMVFVSGRGFNIRQFQSLVFLLSVLWRICVSFKVTRNETSISFHKKLGLCLAHHRTVIYIFTISQFTVTAQSEQELYMWTEHVCNDSSSCERILYVWTGPPTDIAFFTSVIDIKHEIHISITTHHAILARLYHIPRHALQTIQYTMPYFSRPYHIPCHDRPAISYAMPYLARSYHIPCHARQAISYTMPNLARPYPIPCQTSPGHTIYHAIPRVAIRHYMSCPTDHTMPYPTRQ